MVAVILGVLVTVSSLMLAFFLAVSNVSFIVESDFMDKAKQNAVIHALNIGQLGVRAQVLTEAHNTTTVNAGVLRDFHDGTNNTMTYNITYEDAAIKTNVKVK